MEKCVHYMKQPRGHPQQGKEKKIKIGNEKSSLLSYILVLILFSYQKHFNKKIAAAAVLISLIQNKLFTGVNFDDVLEM